MRTGSPQTMINRRGILEVGSSCALGMSLTGLLAAKESASQTFENSATFGRAKSVVVIFLWGGPGQQDLWDPKPNAPSVLRSEFNPISTRTSGIQITDQLPKLSQQTERFTIVRSMTHKDFEHGSAAYTALTGYPHPLPGTNTTARPDDFPTYGSILTKLNPTSKPVPDFVVLGPVMHQGARPPLAGQNAGFLGPGYDAFRIDGDPNERQFKVDGVALPHGVQADRFGDRRILLDQLESSLDRSATNEPKHKGLQQLYQRAFGLLGSKETRQAFELSNEPSSLREDYGRNKFGQTLLLARRLVEAKVPLITVNWSKLNANEWDTHANNYSRLRKMLPPFDHSLACFFDDMHQRGLLESTLVVCLGEFGRTPKINQQAGRDHWPDCYSLLLAGGGIPGGRVFGASNRTAAYPTRDDVAPWDISATMFHLMGLNPHQHINNRQGQPLPLSRGQVVSRLF